MEKDYFKDRPIEVTDINHIKIGTEVYLCVKAMQPIASELDDLSRGIVTKVLTKHNHPRGIKVEITQENGIRVIGRCTYIVKDGLILTKYGLKKENEVNK